MDARFWYRHALAPLALIASVLLILESTALDLQISNLVYRPVAGWLFGRSWWATSLIHSGGRLLVGGIGLAAIGTALGAAVDRRRRRWLPPALYIACCVASIPALVGLLKQFSGVACPWDLAPYGGDYPYAHTFAVKPYVLLRGGCFPGAHSAGGFALMAGYFALRDHSPRPARLALGIALTIGVLFAFGQLVRGAHFVSHDLTSALIAWCMALGLYALVFRRWLAATAPARPRPEPGFSGMPDTALTRLQG